MKKTLIAKLSALVLLSIAPSAHAEHATIGYDRTEGQYYYFSNRATFTTPDSQPYAYVPYYNEGWRVIAFGRVLPIAAHVLAVGEGGWMTVNDNGFIFEFRTAYTGLKMRELKTDIWHFGKLVHIGCAARANTSEHGTVNSVFSRLNPNISKEYVEYTSIAKNSSTSSYTTCEPQHAGLNILTPKDTVVTRSYVAMEVRVNTKDAIKLPRSITIPASRHRIQPYYSESQTAMKPARDIHFTIDNSNIPMVFKIHRTNHSDIKIKYKKSRDKSKGTIVKTAKFKIDMMIGGWWQGHLRITPTCSGNQGLCDSISNFEFQSVAAHQDRIYHQTKMNVPVTMYNQAPSIKVNNQPWEARLHFSNLDQLTGAGKRSAVVNYTFEASI